MAEPQTAPVDLFAEQEALLERIARCQDLLGSAIFRARVALGIEPTTQSFFQDQVSWAKRGAGKKPAPAKARVPDTGPLAAPVAPKPAPAVVPPPPVTVAPPPPAPGDTEEVLAGFTTNTFFNRQVAWTGASTAPVPPAPRHSLLEQLIPGGETPALPVPIPRPAPPPIDYSVAAGVFFRTVPWRAEQTPSPGTRPDGGNFLVAATESALRAARRLSTEPAP